MIIKFNSTETNGIATFNDIGGSSNECTLASVYPYGTYSIKDGVSYPNDKYVKYEDLVFELDPGIQAAGTYMLDDGTLLAPKKTLTSAQKAKVRALSIGDIGDNLSRWAACGGNLTSITYHTWCPTFPVGYDTGSGYVTNKPTALTYENGKQLTKLILSTTSSHGYDYTYFPELNYCYSFDFGISGVNVGDGYCMAPGEHRQWMNQSIFWTNWKKVTGNDIPGKSGSYFYYWSSLQYSAEYSWSVDTLYGSYNRVSNYDVTDSLASLPALQFS